jgi:hypothetical protein
LNCTTIMQLMQLEIWLKKSKINDQIEKKMYIKTEIDQIRG